MARIRTCFLPWFRLLCCSGELPELAGVRKTCCWWCQRMCRASCVVRAALGQGAEKRVGNLGPAGQLALRLAAVSAKAEEYLLTDATFHYSGASEGTI